MPLPRQADRGASIVTGKFGARVSAVNGCPMTVGVTYESFRPGDGNDATYIGSLGGLASDVGIVSGADAQAGADAQVAAGLKFNW
jgi:hypothetical protein